MESKIKYHNCILRGGEESTSRDGKGFWVVVESEKPTSESDRLFCESTFVTGTAIAMGWGPGTVSGVIEELKNKTFSKAKARVALRLFDNGKEYQQIISSDTLRDELKPVEDEYVQRWILTGLENLRRMNPLKYQYETMDVEGFCLILGIPREKYFFNASLLLEDSLIETGPADQFTIENGQIYITSIGVRHLSSMLLRVPKRRDPVGSIGEDKIIKEEFQYDIAISFAGEDRQIAEKLAEELNKRGVKVFYDDFEQAELWGKNLYDHLSYVYGEAARFCIMLLSEHYARKTWTNHERKSAQARAFRGENEYILPIRIDNTAIPGLLETVGYISLSNTTIEKITALVMKKLAKVS